MTNLFLKDSCVAMVTPFAQDGSIDEAALQKFVEWQLQSGTNGLVPVGTTGESPTLSHQEHERVIDLAIEVAKNRVPVIAGCGSNNTDEAISLTRFAKKAGADAAMLVTPYYNKPTQAGLYAHFAAIAAAVDIPIIIYNIPGRSVVDMSVETMARLHKDFPSIIGVKDASNKLERCMEVRLALGDDFIQLTGEDPTVAAFLAQGGHGTISVAANIVPAISSQLHQAWHNKDYAQFASLRDSLFPLSQILFAFGSPTATCKAALEMMGMMRANTRLPIVPIESTERTLLEKTMQQAGLI
ncbi:MAG: 4-hydroxy-tetrahydrodipicolinate synthase [Alphaproteobacteria bacterium]